MENNFETSLVEKTSSYIGNVISDIFNSSQENVIKSGQNLGLNLECPEDIFNLSIHDKRRLADYISNDYEKMAAATGIFNILGGPSIAPGLVSEIVSVSIITARSISSIAMAYGFDPRSKEGNLLLAVGLAEAAEVGGVLAANFVEEVLIKFIVKKIVQRIVSKAPTSVWVNSMKIVPVVGGLVSGGVNYLTLKALNNNAKNNYTQLLLSA